MRLAIVSDTHMPKGRREPPERCTEECRAADLIIHAGDFFAASVLADFEALGPPVVAVHGNVDSADLREREEGGAFQIFNPGSPTERRRAPAHSMGTATIESGEVRFEHLWLSGS